MTSFRGLARNVLRSLVSGGFEVELTNWQRPQLTAALERPKSLLVVDLDGEPADVLWLVRWIARQGLENRTVLLTWVSKSSLLGEVLDKFAFRNVVAKHNPDTSARDIIDETELMVTCHKLLDAQIFGLERYVFDWVVQIHELQVASPEDKAAALNRLEHFLDAMDCYSAIKPAVTLVADELIMNALYNAPRDEQQRAKFQSRDRKLPHQLPPEEAATLRFACDGKNICLSVSDPFGALERGTVIRYLKRCFAEEPGLMEEKAGGAGLGLYMVFSSTTQLVINIDPGRRTEVIAVFYARQGARALRCSGRSLNLFLT